MSFSDWLQIIGNVFILAGYWIMAKSVKWASVALVIGCATYAIWSVYISPWAWPLTILELTCGLMSARTYWLNRSK